MPRTRKTMTGDPAEARATGMPGVRYGEGKEITALAETAPTPNARAAPTPTAPAPPRLPAETALPRGGQPAANPKPGLLLAPTTRPNEPITHGLSRGPGAGPEILGGGSVETPTGRFLRDLATLTGREQFAELARRSNL